MSNKEQKKLNIVLASGSKARQKLIKKLKLKTSFTTSGYKEDMSAIKNTKKLAEFLALGKANFIAAQHPNALIIGADTFIVIKKEKIGKPTSHQHARQIIQKMSGKWIEVISGIAVIKTDKHGEKIKQAIGHEITRLKIKDMSEAEIELLANQKDVLEISGAFSIEGAGGKMVEKIEGDYDNVIGLPLEKLKRMISSVQ